MLKLGRDSLDRDASSAFACLCMTWDGDASYGSDLRTLFFYSSIGVEVEGGSTSISSLIDHEPFSVVSRYCNPGVLSSLDGPLQLEFARLLGRHDGQQWALLQLLLVCTNWAVQLIWLLCDNVIQKPGSLWRGSGQICQVSKATELGRE